MREVPSTTSETVSASTARKSTAGQIRSKSIGKRSSAGELRNTSRCVRSRDPGSIKPGSLGLGANESPNDSVDILSCGAREPSSMALLLSKHSNGVNWLTSNSGGSECKLGL